MIRLEDLNRDYRRYYHSEKEVLFLANIGCQWVTSSNVSAVCRFAEYPNDLVVRFINGSVYRYMNLADKYNDILKSNSKGRWVWDNLRGRVKGRHKVPYEYLGKISLPTDQDIPDEVLFDNMLYEGIASLVLLEQVNMISNMINVLR
jgi:hypothetical protein